MGGRAALAVGIEDTFLREFRFAAPGTTGRSLAFKTDLTAPTAVGE